MRSSLEFAEQISNIRDRDQLWAACRDFFSNYGFDGLIYLDAQPQQTTFYSSFPDYWIKHYQDQGYAKRDPFLPKCCSSFVPTFTGTAFLDVHDYLDAEERELILEAGETGFTAGFASPFRLMSDHGAGGWNILSDMARHDVEKTIEEHGQTLQLASLLAHNALEQANVQPDSPLTAREREVLCWLSKGLRVQQIAHNMGVATVTIEFHLKNARKKLGAKTREQALAIAIGRNLIAP
jgi:DNA-binding CsgD family transcriptional regulator